jgi:hypothetical protein
MLFNHKFSFLFGSTSLILKFFHHNIGITLFTETYFKLNLKIHQHFHLAIMLATFK